MLCSHFQITLSYMNTNGLCNNQVGFCCGFGLGLGVGNGGWIGFVRRRLV